MRTTQRKGDTAVTQAIATFTKNGYDVSIPITESAPYDLIIADSQSVYRLQVRYISGDQVDLRNIHSNAKGYVVKKTKQVTYDWLYVYKSDTTEYLFKECFINRRSVTPTEADTIAKKLKPV